MAKDEGHEFEELTITIKTFFGLEQVLKEELEEMGYENLVLLNRAVQLKGAWNDVYYLNAHLRCALSVLVQVKQFRIKSEQDLYDRALKVDWTEYFSSDKTFAVKGAVFSPIFKHSQYPFLLLKDAIVDVFRKNGLERPNVQVKAPQVLFDLYVRDQEVIISLNTSGAPLFQRGYRESTGEAPLNEVVAAGLLRLAKWDKKTDLFDPFCGSGTLLIEAAMLAGDLPPTIERQHFAFKNFSNYNSDVWEAIQGEMNRRVNSLPCKIVGSDVSAEMMMKTKRNLRGLGLARVVEVQTVSFQENKKPFERGMLISNPPYGERMGQDVETLYEELGTWMKHEMTGFECYLISSNQEALKKLGLRPTERHKVYNGDLECSFRRFSIYEGSKKASKQGSDMEEYDSPEGET